jgi:short subunit dehydrogenase-like uncharacterized protein
MAPHMARSLDLVLFGATGFTGRLVAEYLAKHAPAGTRWAMAGRNRQKLEQVRATLGPGAADVKVLEADSGDAASLRAMAGQATAVCTTVGPYAKYGMPLVEACARGGTHYCDLTGEPLFMRDSIDRFDAVAKEHRARIVHAAGFDSVPSDLGTQLLAEQLGPLRRATLVIEKMRGGFSGGTFASFLGSLEEAKTDRARRRLLVDPYALSPRRDAEPQLGDERDLSTFKFDDFTAQWVAPFVMASVNTRVVRRSNALLDYAWGRSLRYAEVSGMRRGLRGAVRAMGMTAALGGGFAALTFGPTRRLADRFLPKPGEGPSEEVRRNGYLRLRIYGENENGARGAVVVAGQGDPGYLLTSCILGEGALCLALDGSRLPERYGVLTPATAMGPVLRERLVRAGMTFQKG